MKEASLHGKNLLSAGSYGNTAGVNMNCLRIADLDHFKAVSPAIVCYFFQ
jgi:hypothetical protein